MSGIINPGYTGKPYDAATGLYNYGFMDYQPRATWFIFDISDILNTNAKPKKAGKERRKTMKNCFLFLAVIILCINCQKREAAIIQENTESLAVVASTDADGIIIQPVQAEGRTIQETIENYINPNTVLPISRYGNRGLFAFQIEGDFTGSGNREIIAFYENDRSNGATIDSIDVAICFVCDSRGEKIENVYYIEYRTIEFRERNDADTGLVEIEDLGKAITYKDRIIGRVGDFNRNGKEELYLYTRSGRNIEPWFLEFSGVEFEEIIDLGSPDSAPIISIDPKERTITLSIRAYFDGQG